jgi:hypothetical protein
MRISLLLVVLCLTRPVNAQEADPTPASSPPTAKFELPPPEAEAPVADDSRSEPPTVPPPEEWHPISNTTDYRGGFDRPWTSEQPTLERRWYGWQTLATDAISFGVLATAADSRDSGPQVAIGLLGYALGGPVIHAAHGHVGKAFGSLGLRVGAPVVGAVTGFAMEDCEHSDDGEMDFCGLQGAGIGLVIGAASAVILDATVIANDDAEPDAPSQPERGVQLRPDVRIAKDRAQVSLTGSF